MTALRRWPGLQATVADLPPVAGRAAARFQRELKKAFDPDGLFNRGRLYPGL